MVSLCCSMHVGFFLLIPASCCFSSAAFYFRVSLPPVWVTHSCSHFMGVSALAWSIFVLLVWRPAMASSGVRATLNQSLCTVQQSSLPARSPGGHCAVWLSHPAASISLHHTPLHHAGMPRLVKAWENNPLNPQRKDLIKLFCSGIHAACWTACAMTSSLTYECQCFSEAY